MTTQLHFLPVRGRNDKARCQLLLSNISDRSLQYKLKSSSNGNLSALPSSTGHIAAKSTSRITLTLHRTENVASWSAVQKPKILLVTTFNDGNHKQTKEDITNTRLVVVVLSQKSLRTDDPIEQLLLDAVSKGSSAESVEVNVSKATETQKRDMVANQYDQMTSASTFIIFGVLFIIFVILVRNSSVSITTPDYEAMQKEIHR